MPFAHINQIDMYYEIHGTGYPLVLLHGGLSNYQSWSAALPALSEYFQVILPDSRGHGLTNNSDNTELSYRLMADDIIALINMLNLDKPFIGGWSDGGQIALELGINYPDLARGLIVGAAWYKLAQQTLQFSDFFGYQLPGSLDIEKFEAVLTQHGYWETLVASAGSKEKLLYTAQLLIKPWLTDLDYQPEDFAKITSPTLIITGDRDEAIPLEQSLHMYQQISKAELTILPNANHFVVVEQPAKFTTPVIEFMQTLLATEN